MKLDPAEVARLRTLFELLALPGGVRHNEAFSCVQTWSARVPLYTLCRAGNGPDPQAALAAIADVITALPALLDAADENERLRALLGEASQMIGALAAGLFDRETKDELADGLRARIAEEIEK